MRSAINFLRKALNRSVSAGPFGNYHIYGGEAYAQNEQMQAVARVDLAADGFSVPGAELEAALDRMSSDPLATLDESSLSLKSGRLRATIPTTTDYPPTIYSREIDWKPLPGNLIAALRTACPFLIGTAGGWSAAIRLQDERLTVINNLCGIDVAIPGLVCAPSLLTEETAAFLLSQDPPESYGVKPGAAFLFRWKDGRSLHANLVDQVMPEQVEKIFASAGSEAPVALSPDWRAAFEDAAAITEDVIEIRSDAFYVGRGASKVKIEIETAVPEAHVSYWKTKVLAPMLTAATSWNPGAYPTPALFKGPGLYGLVSGIKR